ncbi:MAG: alanine racemase [Phascolarctobacterium sp.]|nr:alanine racemase [Phascolarctobacterium sp.]
MKYYDLDTPALIIDKERMMNNIKFMQAYADKNNCTLRPHTKTHKTPALAKIQEAMGAKGIAVAKIGEAEVMAEKGLLDIFIANEVIGKQKFARIAALAQKGIAISFGVDTPIQITQANEVFAEAGVKVPVLIEIEVGENRSGIIEESAFYELLEAIKAASNVELKGLFSHDGNTYKAKDLAECIKLSSYAQERTLYFAKLAADFGMPCETISYGSTPTFMNEVPILPGITELRPGTYILMDCGQGAAIGTLDKCAATILASVISRPTPERTILDVGAKGLTKEDRDGGICQTNGKGTILEYPETHIEANYDEHAIILDKNFHDNVVVGDKVRVIPNHICPVCNLYEKAYLIEGDEVVDELDIACRLKLQ